MSQHKARSAMAHFSTGIALVLVIGAISWFLHSHSAFRNLEMTNLDVLFLSKNRPAEPGSVTIISITENDYRDPELFDAKSPLSPSKVAQLMRACALSGAKVIIVDLDTSDWSAAERAAADAAVPSAAARQRIVWAAGGWYDPTTEAYHLDDLKGLASPDCRGVPASMPDEYGVVRGYVPVVWDEEPGRKTAVGNLAYVAAQLAKDATLSCDTASQSLASADDLKAPNTEKLVNYAAASFQTLSAKVVLKAADSAPWKNSNPLKGNIAAIGGEYRAARDKYVTPVGYLHGVDILAETIVSVEKGISVPTALTFLEIDFVLGLCLLTATWFLHRVWVVILTFLLVPFMAVLLSVLAFHTTGFFFSFVPILMGVAFHKLAESTIEHVGHHRALSKEVERLQALSPVAGQNHGSQ